MKRSGARSIFDGYRDERSRARNAVDEDANRAILYGSIGLAFLTFCATSRLFDVGGGGVVIWLALLGACSYGVYWVWTQYRAYD